MTWVYPLVGFTFDYCLFFSNLGSPLFKELIFSEAKEVQDPREESKKAKLTLFQRWKEVGKKKYPKFGSLGSGSDFVPFYQFLGESCCYDHSLESVRPMHPAFLFVRFLYTM